MFENILLAAQNLAGYAHKTPVLTSQTLDRLVGANVFLKCENFQKVGAFKFRGAFNAMSRLSDSQKQQGVITYSSGNHAQAIALVGRMLDIKTTIVMPDNAPQTKLKATAAYGANIVTYKPAETARESVAMALQQAHDYTLIPPYNHQDVIAGQGTAALELLQQVEQLEALLVPCGGGGLLSGTAVAAKHIAPKCQVIGIEPELADDATRSFHSGTLHTVNNPPTIADGTRTPSLGELTFPLILEHVDDMKTVSEQAIIEAVQFLFYRLKIVVEPSGALGVAALMSGGITSANRVGVILSGGNIDARTMTKILAHPSPDEG